MAATEAGMRDPDGAATTMPSAADAPSVDREEDDTIDAQASNRIWENVAFPCPGVTVGATKTEAAQWAATIVDSTTSIVTPVASPLARTHAIAPDSD